MGPLLRKKEREALYTRIQKVLREDPLPTAVLAQRFGVAVGLIRRLACELGVDLPVSEYPPIKNMRKFSQKRTGKWGPTGLV